jgi:hypothetical protein
MASSVQTRLTSLLAPDLWPKSGADPALTGPRGTSENARVRAQNVKRVRQNIGSLHRLLNFQEDKTAGQRIARLVEGRVPTESWEPVRSGRGTDLSDRARAWRRKAQECRAAADSMSTEAARDSLLQLVRDYEALAESWEKATQQGGKREQEVD